MSPWAGVYAILTAVALLFIIAVGWPDASLGKWVRGLGGVFGLQMLYAALLLLLLAIYATDPKSLPFPKVVAGVPVGVPWFGAVGAVAVSMSALSDHRHDWDPEWWYWHASRPLVGAIAGSITVLIFIGGILAVQQNPQTSTGADTTKFVYYVIAFIIGYREASFRDLLKSVTDLILKPSGTGQAPSVTGIAPKEGTEKTEVTIYGTGLSQVTSLTFDATEATIKSASDASLIAVAPAHKPGTVPVVVRTKDSTFGGNDFKYTAADVAKPAPDVAAPPLTEVAEAVPAAATADAPAAAAAAKKNGETT